MARRRALLAAATALLESTSATGAIRILREHGGPVASAAIELLAQLAQDHPAVQNGEVQQEGSA